MSSGAFRANQPTKDPEGMQRDLVRIPAVASARVVIEGDDVSEVHLVCNPGRSAKLIGRDVQSLLAAQWGLDIDHRKVSIVQLEGSAPSGEELVPPAEEAAMEPLPLEPPASPSSSAEAVLLATIAVSTSRATAQATVGMARGYRTSSGFAEGAPSWGSQRRLVAEAALRALADFDERLAERRITEVAAVAVGGEDIVVVTITGWDGQEQVNVGAALIGPAGEFRAAAEAVLRAFPDQ